MAIYIYVTRMKWDDEGGGLINKSLPKLIYTQSAIFDMERIVLQLLGLNPGRF